MPEQKSPEVHLKSTTIVTPAGGETVLELPVANPTTVFVQVSVTGISEVRACLHLIGTTPPAVSGTSPPDPIYIALDPQGGGVFSKALTIPTGHACAFVVPTANNLAVSVACKQSSDGVWSKDVDASEFKGVCPTMTADIPACYCPWFAFADDMPNGPEGETMAVHRPQPIPVPTGANSLAITASGTWRHEPTAPGSSGPGGIGLAQPLANAAYNTNTYTKGRITAPAANPSVNTLVGLLEPRDGSAAQIFAIGTTLAPTSVAGKKNLYLAMWDGRQWNAVSSNSGTASVTLNWSPV